MSNNNNLDPELYEYLVNNNIDPAQMNLLMNNMNVSDTNTKLQNNSQIVNNNISDDTNITNTDDLSKTINNIDDKNNENVYVKHKKSRCNLIICKTKLKLVDFSCRCGYKFCSKHRHDFNHHCTFDYTTYHKKILEQQCEKVVNDKINNRI